MNDLTGQQFGRLTVIEQAPSNKHRQAQWLCRCICGNKCVVAGFSLRQGNTKSCGCGMKKALNKGAIAYIAAKNKWNQPWGNRAKMR